MDSNSFNPPGPAAPGNGLPTRSLLPAEEVPQAVSNGGFIRQSGGLPTSGVFQPNVIGTVQVKTLNGSTTTTTPPPTTTGSPMNVLALSATESPFKTPDGVLRSLVAVSFDINPSDKYFAEIQVWFTGYHGSSTPQLMTNGTTSPVSFICDTTHEDVTVTAVSVSPSGVTLPFSSSPVTDVVLDGVTSAPPPPTITQQVVALPNSQGWQFAWAVISGLEADVISGYQVYRSTSSTTPVPPASRFATLQQPTSNNGNMTFQDPSAGATTEYYWVSSYNTTGLESSLVYANTVTGTLSSVYPTTHAADSGFTQYTNPTSAYDGNESSSASGFEWNDPNNTDTGKMDVVYGGWAARTGATPTSMTLKILNQASFTCGKYTVSDDPSHHLFTGTGSGTSTLQYSTNNGSTWTTIYTFTSSATGATRGKVYDSVSLSTSQDLTQVKVRGTATVSAGGANNRMTQNIYEVRIEIVQ